MVIADTSPLNYLILIGADNVLPRIYGVVAVPEAVVKEMHHADAPPVVIQWISKPPEWIRIVGVRETADPVLNELGAGERQAIVLAQEQNAEVLLLMDETRARRSRFIGFTNRHWSASQYKLLRNPSLFNRQLDRDAARRSRSKPRT